MNITEVSEAAITVRGTFFPPGLVLAFFNSLHPNISIYFLHTVLYTFPMALTKRICLTIKSVFSW